MLVGSHRSIYDGGDAAGECTTLATEIAKCEGKRGPFAWTCTDEGLVPAKQWKACKDGEINRGDDVQRCGSVCE